MGKLIEFLFGFRRYHCCFKRLMLRRSKITFHFARETERRPCHIETFGEMSSMPGGETFLASPNSAKLFTETISTLRTVRLDMGCRCSGIPLGIHRTQKRQLNGPARGDEIFFFLPHWGLLLLILWDLPHGRVYCSHYVAHPVLKRGHSAFGNNFVSSTRVRR